MNPALVPYIPALAAITGTIAITAVLAFVSAAVTNGKNLHAGLTPTDIATFPFRAFRAHHNALENTPIMAATTAFAVLVSANPTLVNVSAGVYLLARTLHPAFYYANIAPARTAAYGVGLLGWYGMIAAVFAALAHG